MGFEDIRLKTDLPGHADEVYCVDIVADKVVSGDGSGLLKCVCCHSFVLPAWS